MSRPNHTLLVAALATLSGTERSPAGLVFSRVRITYKHAGKSTTVIAYPRT
jgi:hypothetical protein